MEGNEFRSTSSSLAADLKDVAPAAVQRAINAEVCRILRPVAYGVAALYLVYAAGHLLVLPPAVARIMVPTALVTAVALATIGRLSRRLDPQGRSVHVVSALVFGLILVNGLLHLYLTREPEQTTNILLILIVSGVFFVSTFWFVVVAGTISLSWVVCVLSMPADPLWAHYGFAVLSTAVISSVVHAIRLRTTRRTERARLEEQLHRQQLQDALAETEQARAAAEASSVAARQSEDRFRRLSEAAFEAVLIVEDGIVDDANPAAAAHTGYALDQLEGMPLTRLLRVDGVDLCEELATDGRARDLIIVRADGSSFAAECKGRAIPYRGATAVVVTLRDVTERRQYERTLLDAKRQAEETARMKSSFLANMSHEIRTPLTSIIGFSEILVDEIPQHLRELAGMIQSSGRRLLDTLNSVLEVAHLESGSFRLDLEPTDVVALIEQNVALLQVQAREKGLGLHSAPALDEAWCTIDEAAFHRVLNNLIGNAIKFTSQGHITVSTQVRGSDVVVSVSDTGVGISPTFLPRLFVMFEQESTGMGRSHEGAGLGLSITQHLVHLMHGEIDVHSEPGKGTTFVLTFPRVPAPTPEPRR